MKKKGNYVKEEGRCSQALPNHKRCEKAATYQALCYDGMRPFCVDHSRWYAVTVPIKEAKGVNS